MSSISFRGIFGLLQKKKKKKKNLSKASVEGDYLKLGGHGSVYEYI